MFKQQGMKMLKSIRGLIAIIVFGVSSIALVGCSQSASSDTPSESMAREYLGQWTSKQANAEVVVESFKKTNAVKKQENGLQTYDFVFAAEFSFPKGRMPECVGSKFSFINYTVQEKVCYDALSNGMKPIAVGFKDSGSGAIHFERAENGWRATLVTPKD